MFTQVEQAQRVFNQEVDAIAAKLMTEQGVDKWDAIRQAKESVIRERRAKFNHSFAAALARSEM